MSDLTITLIAVAALGAGYVAGRIHALLRDHKRADARQTGAAYTYHPATGSFSVGQERMGRPESPQAAESKAHALRC